MIKFKQYLREHLEFLMEAKKAKEISAKNRADSLGKIFELLHGKHLNGGKFPEDYRAEGRKPDRKSTRLNSSHIPLSRMPSSA